MNPLSWAGITDEHYVDLNAESWQQHGKPAGDCTPEEFRQVGAAISRRLHAEAARHLSIGDQASAVLAEGGRMRVRCALPRAVRPAHG